MNYRELFLAMTIVIALALPADAQERRTGPHFGSSIDLTVAAPAVSGGRVHIPSNEGTDFDLQAGDGARGGTFSSVP